MKGISKVLFLFMSFSLLLLEACSDETTNKDGLSNEETNESESSPGKVEENEDGKNLPEKDPIQQPTNMIQLIDPNTNEIILSLDTDELGYPIDYGSYVKHIEQLAKNLAQGSDANVGYDERMILDKVGPNGNLIQGSPMVILKEKELVEKILAVSPDGGNVELPIYITETGYDRTEYDTLDDVVIASYTTYFDASVVGRSQNIHLSSNAISNVIVGIGDYFSFNTTVGPRTKETGYQEALEIVNGEFVTGIGGGICQTSSTLFNAVDQLGVRYVERHHHSRSIGYVPKGRDATVSYGTLDFRFKNTSTIPFMIYSTTTKDSITVEIRTSSKYAEQLN
ncbi:MAG TPA: VanW family protein [Ureibacillus sp.]|nr:VanW family protein [Ureibacillus sp.]